MRHRLEDQRAAFVDLPRWRVFRKHGPRLLIALSYAANRLYAGPTRIRELVTPMLVKSGLHMVADVTATVVVQWLLRTGVAIKGEHGWLASGPNCKLYADGLWEELGISPR